MTVDLTKIEKPFGLLDKETQDDLRKWNGGWEVFVSSGAWGNCHVPSWSPNVAYRAKPVVLVPDSINWDHVSPEYVCMMRDEDDVVGLLTSAPIGVSPVRSFGGRWVNARAFTSYKQGTVSWQDSLVFRPR